MVIFSIKFCKLGFVCNWRSRQCFQLLEVLNVLKECLHEYVFIAKAEEAFLKQKARNQWLQLGDQNKSYFHRMLKAKIFRNTITHLWDENGQKVEEVERIQEVAVNFYKLLGLSQMYFDETKVVKATC